MRRLVTKTVSVVLLMSVLLAGSTGCKRKKKRGQDEPAGLATMLQAADPRAATQLVRGFHAVESGAWRWTEKSFAVTLHPPAGASVKGATLVLKFVFPEVALQKLGPVTLSARVGTQQLSPETIDSAGDKSYSRDVPASVLKDDAVTVEFTLDKAIPPGGADIRELGVIMNMVGFEAKQ